MFETFEKIRFKSSRIRDVTLRYNTQGRTQGQGTRC